MNLPAVWPCGSPEAVEVRAQLGLADAQFAALLALMVPQARCPEPGGRAEPAGPPERADGSIQQEAEHDAVSEGETGESSRASAQGVALPGPVGLTAPAARVHAPVLDARTSELLEAPATDAPRPARGAELSTGPRRQLGIAGSARPTPPGLPVAMQVVAADASLEAGARRESRAPAASPAPATRAPRSEVEPEGADPVPLPPQFHGAELELPRLAAGRPHAAGLVVLPGTRQEHHSDLVTAAPSSEPLVSPGHPGPTEVPSSVPSSELPRGSGQGQEGKPRSESGAAASVDGLRELRAWRPEPGPASTPGSGPLSDAGAPNVAGPGVSVGQADLPEGLEPRGQSEPGPEAQLTVAETPPRAAGVRLREPGMQAAPSGDSAGAPLEASPDEEAARREPGLGRFEERAKRTLEVAQRTGRAAWTAPEAHGAREEGAPREPGAAAPVPPEAPSQTSAPQRLRLELRDTRGEPVRLEVRARSDTVWARVEASPEVAQAVRGEAAGLHQALGGRGLSLAGLEVDILPRGRGRGPEEPVPVGPSGRVRTQRRVDHVRMAAGSVDYVV